MPDKTLGLDSELRLFDRLDHIANEFLNDNGGGSSDYNYFSLHQVVNMHDTIAIIMRRALA